MKTYAITCWQCGTAFEAGSPAARYCCQECRKIALKRNGKRYRESDKGRAQKAVRMARYKAEGRVAEWNHKYAVSDKNKANQKRYSTGAHREERLEYNRVYMRAKRNKPGAKLALAKLTGKLAYCERMRLTAFPLPCGKRGECEGCQHCPKGATFGKRPFNDIFAIFN